MTVNATTRKAGPYTGNGVTVAFPFSFKVFAGSEVVVTQTDLSLVETVKTLTTDYTVSLNADQDANPGGTVNMVVAPTTGYLITLTSNVTQSQGVTLTNGGGFYPKVISDALDRATILIQQLGEQVGRALTVPVSSSLTVAQYIASIVASAGGIVLPVSIAQGGTGATTAATARAALGAGTGDALQTGVQLQSYTKFTAGGTVDAITGTLSSIAYATGTRVTTVPPGANTAAAPTINLNTLGGKKVFKRDTSGAAVALAAGDYNASGPFDFEYNAALDSAAGGWVLLNPMAASASGSPPVRQTVLSASVDTSGLPNFMSGVGTTTLTIAGSAGTPFIATAANGFNSSGPVDRIGSSAANLTLAGQSTNGTYYAYVDIASNGTLTLGASSLAPSYPAGGAYSTTNGQFQFNYLGEMVGKLGSGSAAAQAYRTYIGEFTVAANVIATVTPYALMGRYVGETAYASNTKKTVSHNLGVQPGIGSRFVLRCATAELNYAVNDETDFACLNSVGQLVYNMTRIDRLFGSAYYVGATTYLKDANTGNNTAITDASWKVKLYANRGW